MHYKNTAVPGVPVRRRLADPAVSDSLGDFDRDSPAGSQSRPRIPNDAETAGTVIPGSRGSAFRFIGLSLSQAAPLGMTF